VPNAIGDNLRIKVCDATNCDNVYGESAQAFTIKGKLKIDYPDISGISLEVNAAPQPQILWTPTGTWPSVEIHYATDGNFGGANVFPFKYPNPDPLTANDGSEDWQVPDRIGNALKIRIRDPDHTDVQAISDKAFSIVGKIASVSPPGLGDTWYVGDPNKDISWDAIGTVTNVDIAYKTSAGGVYNNPIATNDDKGGVGYSSGTNHYYWPVVGDAKTETAYIRVCVAGSTSICAESAEFKIRPTITISTPNSSSKLKVGSNNNPVSFTYTGNKITAVNVRYDTNNGDDGFPVTNVIQDGLTVNGGSGQVNWNGIPNAIYPTPKIKVRVVDVGNPNVKFDTEAFRIIGDLLLTTPTGQGTSWTAGSNQNIGWNFGGSMKVNVSYNLNSGVGAWTPIQPVSYKDVSGSSGSTTLGWDLPLTATNKARVKIVADDDPNVVSQSEEDFKIGAKFDIWTPENGLPIYVGDSYDITWEKFAIGGVTAVAIEYTNDDSVTQTWHEISYTATNSGIYPWTVPGTADDLSNDCRVRIYQYDPTNDIANTVNQGQGLAFRIVPRLYLTNPVTLTYNIGDEPVIKFKKRGAITKVDLWFSYDGGPTHYTYKINGVSDPTGIDISALADNIDKEYTWHIADDTPLTPPLPNGGKIKVKVVEPSNQASVEAIETNSIEIRGNLTLLTPSNHTDMVYTGPDYLITWSRGGEISSVKLYYSTTGGIIGGGSYPEGNLIGTFAGDGNKSWPVPNAIGDNLRIKVCDATNCDNVYGESAQAFTIKGKLKIDYPDVSGISLEVNAAPQPQILWTPTGTWPTVEIHYATDGNFGGANVFPFKYPNPDPLTANDGSEDWQVPDRIGNALKIRIRDPDHTDVQAISDKAFSIVGRIASVDSPGLDELWYVGDTNKDISWNTIGTITNVDIAYKLGAGGSYEGNTIATNDGGHTIYGTNHFYWPVVDNAKNEAVYIRVCVAGGTTICAESQKFKIRPKIAVTIDDADGRLPVGSYVTTPLIKWTCTGTGAKGTSNVDVKYDLYNGLGLDGKSGTPQEQIDDYAGTIVTGEPVANGTIGIPWNNSGLGVPDTMTPQPTLKIKVVDSDSAAPNVFGVSTASLKIVGDLTLDQPTIGGAIKGEFLKVGQEFLIKWSKKGSGLTAVTLWYSDDGGLDEFPHRILPVGTDSIPTSGSGGQYTWPNIPNTTSNNVVVRISDYNDLDTQYPPPPPPYSTIHIQSTLDIFSPDGGETFAAGDNNRNISWDTSGKASYVKLQYCTNGGGVGGDWTDITGADSLANNWTAPPAASARTTFTWNNIPTAAISNDVKVRVVDKADGENWNESATTFRIRPSITVVSPNGAAPVEEWLIGSSHPIKWSIKDKVGFKVNLVDLLYSVDGGDYTLITTPSTATDIDATIGETTGWSWQIPNNVSSQVRVKVVDSANPTPDLTVVDTSDFDFSIQGQIDFSPAVPAAGDNIWYVGENKTVSWTKTTTIPTVKLQYCTNGTCANDGDWTTITGAGNLGGLSHQFAVPDAIGYSVKIRAASADAARPAIPAVSGAFEIADTITIEAPVSEPRWGVGTTPQIKWHTEGSLANVKIEYSLDGTVVPPENIVWVTPAIYDPTASNSRGVTVAKDWFIPTATATSSKAVIRISDVDTGSGTLPAVSNTFRIVGSFTFDAPTSSSNWPVIKDGQITYNPSYKTIQWHTQGLIPLVNLWYSIVAGHAPATFTQINTEGPISVVGTNGSYNWTVPDAISQTVTIRIEDNADPYLDADHIGTSNLSSDFTIRGDIKLTNPIVPGGTIPWKVDQTNPDPITMHDITWLSNGTMGDLYISYSLGSCNASWVGIEKPTGGYNIPNLGSFSWQIPTNAMTSTACVKIENAGTETLYVKSDSGSTFKISAKFDITDPDGGETLMAGQSYTMHWNKWGTGCSTVQIDLALNGDAQTPTYNIPITPVGTANDGSHGFTPDENWVTPAAKIRIYDKTNADMDSVDTSFSSFAIRANFVFQEPPAEPTANLEVGQSFHIIWTKVGNIPNVKLQYSPAALGGTPLNFTTDIRNIDGSPNNDGIVPNEDDVSGDPTQGRFIWTVPDIEDNKDVNIHLRVMDPNDPGAFVISPAFNIIPKFTVIFPNGNSDPNQTNKLKVGTAYTLQWTASSSPAKSPKAVLNYSTTGGGVGGYPDEKRIATIDTVDYCVSNLGVWDCSYLWPPAGGIPNDISTQVKIRVKDGGTGVDSLAEDESNYNWKIISDFTLSNPNDGGANGYYEVGDPLNITWTNKGTVPDVELAYSTNGDNFSSHTVFVPSLDNGSDFGTTYPWTVSNAISYTVRVRVRSLTDDGFAISANNFRIRGKFTNITVNGGQPVPIGENKNIPITWTTYGTIPNVDIVYDTYDGKGHDGIVDNADDYWNMGADGVPGGTGANADYLNVIATNLPNCTPTAPALTCSGSATWVNVPDNPSAFAKIKVFDRRTNPDNTDARGISTKFNIVGNFAIQTPSGGEDWRVDTHPAPNITWTWGGTIPKVKLFYSKNEAAEPATIPEGDWIEIDPLVTKDYSGDPHSQSGHGDGSGGVTRTYDWKIPNDIAPKVRIRIQDYNDPTVKAYSNFFKIRGTLVLTSPVGNANLNLTERWVTNEKRNISWTTTGTIPTVKLQYSDDGFVSDIHEIILAEPYTKQNCLPTAPEVTCTKSHEWTIPDDVLKDNDLKYTDPNIVKVRVFDINDPPTVNDPGVSDTSDNFKIDYYQMTWKIYDLSTGETLSNLSYTEKITGTDIVNRTGGGLASKPSIILPTTYGTWTTTWVAPSYGEKAQNFVANTDQTFTLFLETTVIHIWRAYSEFGYTPATTTPAVPDSLNISSWLERDGVVVDGATIPDVSIYDGLTRIKRLTAIKSKDDPVVDQITIYYYQNIPDGAVELWIGERDDGSVRTIANVIADIAALGPSYKISQETINKSSFAGFFKQVWTSTTLASGTVYNIITDMMNASGAHFRTPGSFEVTASKSLQEMYAKVNSVLDKPISEVRTDLLSIINAQTQTINTAMSTQTTTINTAMETQTNLIDQRTTDMKKTIDTVMASFDLTTKESLTKLAEGAQQAVEAGEILQETALKYSWQASVSPNPALVNDMITLQCQGQPGKSPFLTIYSWDNKYIIRDQVLTESSTPGLYVYEFKADARFTPGKAYTYMVTESTTNGMVSGSGSVESMSLTTIAGLASAAPEAERAAKNALDAIRAVEAVLISADNVNIALTLRNLKDSVDSLPEVLSKEGPSARISEAVNELSARLNKLIGGEGYDLSSLLEEALSSSPTIKEIRGKADTINAIIDILLQIIEGKLGGVDTPIVSTSLAPGSVRFRIIALNPSKIKTQRVQVKNYLPIEVKPKNITDLGGLELDYDSAKSIYYLYKPDLELAPAEVRVFEVEVEDIWMVPEHKLADLRKRTNEILTRLEKTERYAEAKDIANTIYPRLDEIAKSQMDEAVSREQHIGIYRQNLLTIKQIEEDIDKLEKILRPSAGAPIPEILEKARLKLNLPSKSATWLIILMIIVFLGLLAGVFFFVWQAQVRSSQDILKSAKDSAFPEEKPKEKKSEDKPSTEEKK